MLEEYYKLRREETGIYAVLPKGDARHNEEPYRDWDLAEGQAIRQRDGLVYYVWID